MLLYSGITCVLKWVCVVSFVSLDINECIAATPLCDTNTLCDNTEGSFTCTCNSGYSGDGTVAGSGCTGEWTI